MLKAKVIISKIISVRRKILSDHRSGKNEATCHRLISELSLQISAYGKRWDDVGWTRFAERNKNTLTFLIPENSSGQILKQQLNEAIESISRRNS